MTRCIRPALAWRGLLSAGAASLLLVLWHGAWAQTVIRVTRGDGAMVLPNGPNCRIGAPCDSPQILASAVGVCCPNPSASPRPRCITERQVPLGARRVDVLSRYGPVGSDSNNTTMRYPGIVFTLDNDEVIKICAVR